MARLHPATLQTDPSRPTRAERVGRSRWIARPVGQNSVGSDPCPPHVPGEGRPIYTVWNGKGFSKPIQSVDFLQGFCRLRPKNPRPIPPKPWLATGFRRWSKPGPHTAAIPRVSSHWGFCDGGQLVFDRQTGPKPAKKMRCLDASPPKLEYYRGFPEILSSVMQGRISVPSEPPLFQKRCGWGFPGRNTAGGWVKWSSASRPAVAFPRPEQ